MTTRTTNPETLIVQAIMGALAYEPALKLERNNSGVFGRHHVRAGLGKGSSDLLGMLTVMVYPVPGAVPVKLARFIALEVKRPGHIPSELDVARYRVKLAARPLAETAGVREMRTVVDQWDYLDDVRQRGGFGAYVDSPEAARAAIARARLGASS